VPLAMLEFTAASSRFHLKPLIPVLTGNLRFYVLALSQKHVAFYVGSRDRFDEVELEGVPRRSEDVVGYAVDQPGLQLSTRSPQFGGGARATGGPRGRAIYHGQGASGDEATRKTELRHFLERLDAALWAKIQDHQPPLVLIGVDYVIGEYRARTKYPNLYNVAIDSEPDSLSKNELHREAWRLVSMELAAARAESAERFHDLLPHAKASAVLDEVLAAAHDGRIDRMFVAEHQEIWGTFDPATRRLSLEDAPRVGNYDLLDDAARETLAHAGQALVVAPEEIPTGAPLAAIFRW
jgi:hypothetical protein